MQLRCLAVLAALVACAPREASTSVAWPDEQWIVEDVVGLGFAIPADWTLERATTGLVASGREGAPAYDTLSVQTLHPPPELPLASLLDAGYTNDAITEVNLLATGACVAGDALALCYDITFDVFDEHRHRVGALINAVPYVVDVSYLSPAAELDGTVAVFERALETLYIEPAG